MAPGFREAATKIPIPAGEEIQEESEVKVGKAEVDEGCKACAA